MGLVCLDCVWGNYGGMVEGICLGWLFYWFDVLEYYVVLYFVECDWFDFGDCND